MKRARFVGGPRSADKSADASLSARDRARQKLLREEQAKLDIEMKKWQQFKLKFQNSNNTGSDNISPKPQKKEVAKETNIAKIWSNPKKTFSAEKYQCKSAEKNLQSMTECSSSRLMSSLKKPSGSSTSKKVHFSDAAKKNSAEKPPKNIKRNLFAEGNNSGVKENIPAFVETYDPDGSILNYSNESNTNANDSNAEFNQYESLCESPVPASSQPSHNSDVFTDFKKFIEEQNELLREKINVLIEANNDAIFAKFEELQQKSTQSSKDIIGTERLPLKRKSDNLRVNLMKKSFKSKCPDTPGTRMKMKKAIDMYNSVRQNLDSPLRESSSLQRTSSTKVAPKSALSLILQKQCFDLLD
ncbi:uncharacterized protein [Atheta coriaria]|uniref:uncharacterized protein n=1 Tax=Dalotia coriaria TaxID=877792 RepID=UPI0031F37FA2